MKKDLFGNIVAGILSLCALTVTALLVKRELVGPAAASERTARTVDDWRDYTAGRELGTSGAPVTIVEFSDFQCPYCKALASRLDTLAAKFRGRVSWRFRHYPMNDIHPRAVGAAIAAECAGQQGRFKQYHDALYASQDSIPNRPWAQFAVEAGVPDIPRFDTCTRDSLTAPRVREDLAAGAKLGVRGTPAILIDGQFHSGAPPLAWLEGQVNAALRRANQRR